ncbi:sigma-70 family RNA polymerase sigma factor [Kordiimonas laminariae]|uniref:sigma-70 family RNA polymerase sigma factor n=1 Tax=Kordiimonas laminariae TaxID=2917717 RepID=UPI001FF5262F|nr:sigma-70 family RNA polymerase sigma factor [Kordiimonas laminariae]MCK0070879.1 sigma-70 family RNA polymerase sigma factor [Kordiimonas laminariae]
MKQNAIIPPVSSRVEVPCQDTPPFLTGHLSSGHHDTRDDLISRKVIPITPLDNNSVVSFEELARCVAENKDKTAFAELFSHFAPRLKSYLLKHGLPDTVAEEISQEAMITFWQKAALFNPTKAKFSTWIFRVARNRMIDLKRKKKYPEVNADDHMAHLVATDRTDKPLEVAQDVNLIGKALVNLNAAQRQVIELSFFEELSHSQISERLSIPLGTVKSRIRMAFNTLRRELGDR